MRASASLPPLAGTTGDAVGGWISDLWAKRSGNLKLARRGVALLGFLLAAGSILPATLTTSPVACVWYTCLAVFGLELTVGVSWAIPLDIGADFAGFVSAVVDRNECVECYACFNGLSQEHLNPTLVRTMRSIFKAMRLRFEPEPDVCPTAAFEPDKLEWPRVVRRAFSDPRVPHESTGVSGRGTEEVKTNDVSGRVKVGEVGFTIEFGRPGVGVWFSDIQKMAWAMAKAGVSFEKKNPVTSLMTDVATGTLREDILGEKVMSAILEIKTTRSEEHTSELQSHS